MPRCSKRKVNTIIAGLAAGWLPSVIAEQAEVSKMTVYRMRTSLDLWGEPYPPSIAKIGRPRSLLLVHKEVRMRSRAIGL